VKIRNLYRAILPLLLAFVNVIGGNAYSANTPVQNLDPRNYDYLQEGQNTSALYIQELSARGSGPVFSFKDPGPCNDLISGKNLYHPGYLKVNNFTSIIIRDQKEILKTYIFPFHFFW